MVLFWRVQSYRCDHRFLQSVYLLLTKAVKNSDDQVPSKPARFSSKLLSEVASHKCSTSLTTKYFKDILLNSTRSFLFIFSQKCVKQARCTTSLHWCWEVFIKAVPLSVPKACLTNFYLNLLTQRKGNCNKKSLQKRRTNKCSIGFYQLELLVICNCKVNLAKIKSGIYPKHSDVLGLYKKASTLAR